MPWAAAAAAAGAIGGALISSNATKSAANKQSEATQASLDEQRREFDTNQQNQAPYLAAGRDALGQLQTGINKPVTSADVMSDPGYQFGLDQGQTALDRKIAAMGGRVSGAALKGATRYATDYATTGYNAAYQRGQDRLNRLAALAGVGQTATNASAQSGQANANAITGLLTNQGDATAASRLAQGNIWGNAGNQLAAIANRYYTPSSSGGGPYLGQGTTFYGGSGSTLYGDGYGPE
jgi:hypothetical protein